MTSAYCATNLSDSLSIASVTIFMPNLSRTSAMICRPSSSSPWKESRTVRALYAPPRKDCAPARHTRSAAANAWSRLSSAHGPAMIATPDPPKLASVPGNEITEFSSLKSRLTSLYGLLTRISSCTPGISSSVQASTSPLFPVTQTAVRCAPGIGCARYPSDSIFWQTARTCSSLACACITTNMHSPQGNSSLPLLPASQQTWGLTSDPTSISCAAHRKTFPWCGANSLGTPISGIGPDPHPALACQLAHQY